MILKDAKGLHTKTQKKIFSILRGLCKLCREILILLLFCSGSIAEQMYYVIIKSRF